MPRIYLDHAATTPVAPEVAEAMQPYLSEVFGNPSSIHGFGRQARAALDKARDTVAACLGALPEEVFFTSGGTEADNTVLLGVTEANAERGDHVITSAIEHHAVLDTCEYLAERGVRVTVLPVDSDGMVDPEAVRAALTERTVLVSLMYANNEVGTVQPIAEVGRVCREAGVLFHTDAVQAAGYLPLDVNALNVDFLALSAHKFYGPKGVGVLYARKGARWHSLLHGGGQERGRRAGTQNVPGIVGLATALAMAEERRPDAVKRAAELRDRLIAQVFARIPRSRLNGHPEQRLPHNAHFSFAGVQGEALLINLDMAGIAASGGSACASGAIEPSHVLREMGVPAEFIQGSLRLTLGRGTTEEEIDRTADALVETVTTLRRLDPSYQE